VEGEEGLEVAEVAPEKMQWAKSNH
jgi:hypothetical protein